MGQEISTAGGVIATAGTTVVAGVTLGQVESCNNAVVDCAKYTSNHASQTLVRHCGETAVHSSCAVGNSVASKVCRNKEKVYRQAARESSHKAAESAKTLGKQSLELVDGISDGMPVVGHIKGGAMYALGYSERGERALKSATRTTAVITAGTSGFLVGGPGVAVGAGVAAGAAVDGLYTGIDYAIHREYRPSGQIAAWTAVMDGKSSDVVISGVIGSVLTPLLDGCTGLTAGRAVTVKPDSLSEMADFRTLSRFLDGDGNISLEDAFAIQDRLSARTLMGAKLNHEKGKSIKERGKEKEQEIDRDREGERVLNEREEEEERDESHLYTVNGLKYVAVEAIEEERRRLLPNRQSEFSPSAMSDTEVRRPRGKMKHLDLCREFTRRVPTQRDFKVLKERASDGVDVTVAGHVLQFPEKFLGQHEVSIFGSIHQSEVQGVLTKINDALEWVVNPLYTGEVSDSVSYALLLEAVSSGATRAQFLLVPLISIDMGSTKMRVTT
mmetsp:Transcript_24154/g.24421  ORF Transcript_24154/g.24421 Transcript_24154/m.24421 type:complete len:499 (-) Transcript_24154:260-1756(-)